MIIETIGLIGSIILSCCTLPQSIKSIVQGHSNGLSFWSLFLAWIGGIFLLTYMIASCLSILVMANILFLILSMSVQLKYLIWPRNKEKI
jgi:hypothetical protein